jgi:hypothetical protein
MTMPLEPLLALEAKALTALTFRNGPIEDLHAGKLCTACAGNAEYSHLSNEEMKRIMKSAVNAMYRLLWQREHDSAAYLRSVDLGLRYTREWDDPEVKPSPPSLR